MNIHITNCTVHLHSSGNATEVVVDGKPLSVSASESGLVNPTAAPAHSTEVDTDDIYGAINSDPRFHQRSADAIKKHLSTHDAAAVDSKITWMENHGYLTARHNRAGVTLYRQD